MGATGTILCRLGGGRASPGPGDAPDPGRRPGGRRLGAPHRGRWPALPTALPSWDELGLLARSPMISFAALRPVLVLVLWALWLWFALSFVTSLIVALAERLAGGAAWVGALRATTALLACPPVRRAVHRALATASRSRSPPAAWRPSRRRRPRRRSSSSGSSTRRRPPSPRRRPRRRPRRWRRSRRRPAEARPAVPAAPAPVAVVRHTVAPGECLSRIAEWYYDDWKAYPRIARDPANRSPTPT